MHEHGGAELYHIVQCIDQISVEFYKCISRGCQEQPSRCIVTQYCERPGDGEGSIELIYLGLCEVCFHEYGEKLFNWCKSEFEEKGYVSIGKYAADALDGIPHKGHFFYELD